jgi:hypothetical protein
MARQTRAQISASITNAITTLLSGKDETGADYTVPVDVSYPVGPTSATNSTNAVTAASSTIQAANASRKN